MASGIKHNLGYTPLCISIRTRETDSGSEIVVEDNDLGFAPDDDCEPHIALANIRQRLEMMCSGKLMIRSRKGGGTVVTITIPCQKITPIR